MKKRILFYGDSNTHGINPDNFSRYDDDIRFTGIVQNKLGEGYTIIEEGLMGRTTVMDDPGLEGANGLTYLVPCLSSHAPIDTMVIMLGTNDSREVYGLSTHDIAANMERVLKTAMSLPIWRDNPDILLLAPHPIEEVYENGTLAQIMGHGCTEKTRDLSRYYREIADRVGTRFLDIKGIVEISSVDGIHFTKESHAMLAEALLPFLK